jgi:hypothetical protein
MRSLAAAAVLAASVGSSAAATTLHEPTIGLEVDFTVPTARVCFLKPKILRTDPAACQGLDVAGAEQRITADMWMIGIVRFTEWTFTVAGVWWSKRLPGAMTDENGREFLRGAAEEAQGTSLKVESLEPDFITINGLQVLRFMFVPRDSRSQITVLHYVAVGKESLVDVQFLTDTAHLGRVREIAEKSMASLRMPAAHRPGR